MNIAQKKAIQFIFKYKLNKNTLSRDTIQSVLERQGYRVFRFCRNGSSSDEVQREIQQRNLLERIQKLNTDCFTHIRNNDRAIFVNDRLSEETEQYVLLHEQGHISYGHLSHHILDGTQYEQEANAFAFYVMHYINLKEKFRGLFLMGGVLLIAFYLIMLLVLLMR